MRVSAVVITFNEEKNIERCLQSLKFCDEIIVVDSYSQDKTLEKASEYTSKISQKPWAGYVAQKNHAVSLASSDWILSIDADEEVSKELREEIQRVLQFPLEICRAYSIPRKNLHSGKWIRYGGWYPNRLVRLFQKDCGRWVGNELHERWESQPPIGELSEPLIHYSFDGISDQVTRNNRYSSLGALALYNEGLSSNRIKPITKGFSKFCETFFVKRGFLDGYRGFIISVSASYSVFLKWAKLWELQQNEKNAI